MNFLDGCFSGDRALGVSFEEVLKAISLNIAVKTAADQLVKFDNALQLFGYAYKLGYTVGLQDVALDGVKVWLDDDGKTVKCRFKDTDKESHILHVEDYQ
jgi:hypothetical protein